MCVCDRTRFHLRKANILPVGDLGVRKGMMQTYGLRKLPSPKEMEDIAQMWGPNRSIGSFYMWRSQEKPQASTSGVEVKTPEKTPKRKAGNCPWLDGANDVKATPLKKRKSSSTRTKA